MSRPRILILGGGYIGLYSALSLEKELKHEADVTLVNRENYMVYQPFLPEAASGSIEPRHVVVPLRRVLKRTKILTGEVTDLDGEQKIAVVRPWEGPPIDLGYDILVVGLGSVARVLPIPGLAEGAIGFKTVEEAIFLRNQVLSRLDAAHSARDEATKRRALSFVFVGGGYAGVEALAELEDLARDALRDYFPGLSPQDMRWILVEATERILPEMGRGMGDYALDLLRDRGIDVRLNTTLESADGGSIQLSDGERLEADTLVWTAGVRPHPLLRRLGLPLDEQGRVPTDRYLRVRDMEDVWAGGDCAAIPAPAGGFAPPTAQHALREGQLIGRNIARSSRGTTLRPFTYKGRGMLVALGHRKGVARVLGRIIHGLPAWFLHRTYHVSRIPTPSRKVRILLDWTAALFFKRDVVQLGSLHHPREPFEEAFSDEDG